MKQKLLSGRCACGQVVFQVMADTACAVCYCETCRRASGSWGMAWIDGVRSSLSINGPVARWRSSAHAYRHYCASCGTQLLLLEDAEEENVEISVGSLDEQDRITVDHESYSASRPAWVAKPNG
ncbi:MAG: GFA family protein [Pseudoxanthomonas sp.]